MVICAVNRSVVQRTNWFLNCYLGISTLSDWCMYFVFILLISIHHKFGIKHFTGINVEHFFQTRMIDEIGDKKERIPRRYRNLPRYTSLNEAFTFFKWTWVNLFTFICFISIEYFYILFTFTNYSIGWTQIKEGNQNNQKLSK